MKKLTLVVAASAALVLSGCQTVPLLPTRTQVLLGLWRVHQARQGSVSPTAWLAEDVALTFALCGPEGATDATAEGPTCERYGWSGRAYVTPCQRPVDYVCEPPRP
jgi:hypothetical protein